jgi:hypothetical protein
MIDLGAALRGYGPQGRLESIGGGDDAQLRIVKCADEKTALASSMRKAVWS